MATIHELLKSVCTNVDDETRLSIELLLAHVLQQPRAYLHTWPDKMLPSDLEKQFHTLLTRYHSKEPIAYIIGEREFWSLMFKVTPATLIPRPETECLLSELLSSYSADQTLVVADLGTGSGAIAIALAVERPRWQIHAVEQSEAALCVAKENAKRHAVTHIHFHQGHWCDALPALAFDVIVSNPPYISTAEWPAYAEGLAFEPKAALLSGTDGLDAIREIVATAKSHLKPGGILLVEHGYQQAKSVVGIFKQQGFIDVHHLFDLSGRQRATQGCVDHAING